MRYQRLFAVAAFVVLVATACAEPPGASTAIEGIVVPLRITSFSSPSVARARAVVVAPKCSAEEFMRWEQDGDNVTLQVFSVLRSDCDDPLEPGQRESVAPNLDVQPPSESDARRLTHWDGYCLVVGEPCETVHGDPVPPP